MKKFKDRVCIDCNGLYTPTGPAAKRCPVCAKAVRLANARRNTQRHRIKNGLVQKPGVGKGGNQKYSKDNPQYKNGSRFFQNNRNRIHDEVRYCERCGKDLKYVGSEYWCIHHRDHNRDNNTRDNFELLCKSCHQIEHECIRALQ